MGLDTHLPIWRSHRLVASPHDDRFAAAGIHDGDLRFWSFDGRASGELIGAPIVMSVDCSPDGRLIASGDEEGRIRLWGTDGKLTEATPDHGAAVTSVA
jgi:WD40 repeat protein